MKKVVLLTGASSGIGNQTARLLAEKGYKVYAAARRTEKLEELKSFGIKPIHLDVSNENSIVNAVESIMKTENRIDILINNAGFGTYGALEDVSIETARYQYEVNVFGVARLIQLVLPSMRKNKYGKIINITSGGGRFATPYGSWYHSSKFALEGLSDSLRNEVKQFGIDVVIIEPGAIESEFAHIALDSMVKNADKSAYKEAITRTVDANKKMVHNASKPIVISKLILKGIESKNPKTRYAGGFGIKPTLFMRWLLSDKLFDKMLQSQLKF
ncbi:oxidoreductase [Plebeiibacterium marinum]|uniref:Oxidoreductase n=1 Tax=Plebeiibacterium marinum TaxID=2992111 RepID=A0AAE3SKM7_9BACT|nr:oxidoreductase [Plebeiobacterium marinum]MCW3806782.1 oxidoreductase [Plebeiobacterium marinum]